MVRRIKPIRKMPKTVSGRHERPSKEEAASSGKVRNARASGPKSGEGIRPPGTRGPAARKKSRTQLSGVLTRNDGNEFRRELAELHHRLSENLPNVLEQKPRNAADFIAVATGGFAALPDRHIVRSKKSYWKALAKIRVFHEVLDLDRLGNRSAYIACLNQCAGGKKKDLASLLIATLISTDEVNDPALRQRRSRDRKVLLLAVRNGWNGHDLYERLAEKKRGGLEKLADRYSSNQKSEKPKKTAKIVTSTPLNPEALLVGPMKWTATFETEFEPQEEGPFCLFADINYEFRTIQIVEKVDLRGKFELDEIDEVRAFISTLTLARKPNL